MDAKVIGDYISKLDCPLSQKKAILDLVIDAQSERLKESNNFGSRLLLHISIRFISALERGVFICQHSMGNGKTRWYV